MPGHENVWFREHGAKPKLQELTGLGVAFRYGIGLLLVSVLRRSLLVHRS